MSLIEIRSASTNGATLTCRGPSLISARAGQSCGCDRRSSDGRPDEVCNDEPPGHRVAARRVQVAKGDLVTEFSASREPSDSSRTLANMSAEAATVHNDGSPVLLKEYRALAASIAEERERAERLRALGDQAMHRAEQQEQALRDLAELMGLNGQSRIEELDVRLRGQRLREIAVQVLSDRHPHGEPIHYRQWYGLLREAGYAVGGKDPLATFLAAIARSTEIRAVGRRSGLYAITGGKARAARGAR